MTKSKLIAFNVKLALDDSVGEKVPGIDKFRADAVDRLKIAGVPISAKGALSPEEIEDVQVYFKKEEIDLLDLGMIEVPGMKILVMAGELTVGHFNQFLEARKNKGNPYEIVGDNASSLIKYLLDFPSYFEMAGLSYEDAMEYVFWRNKQPGEKMVRLPTYEEIISIHQIVGGLTGNNCELTSTPSEGAFEKYYTRNRKGEFSRISPKNRYSSSSVRLIEIIL